MMFWLWHKSNKDYKKESQEKTSTGAYLLAQKALDEKVNLTKKIELLSHRISYLEHLDLTDVTKRYSESNDFLFRKIHTLEDEVSNLSSQLSAKVQNEMKLIQEICKLKKEHPKNSQ